MISDEHLLHLRDYLNNNFTAVAFDNTSRQMDKHYLSAKYTPQRVIEVFDYLLKREKREYLSDLELRIKLIKSQKNELKGSITKKRSKYEGNLHNLCTENTEIRKMLASTKNRMNNIKWKNKRVNATANDKLKKLESELKNIKKPIALVKQQFMNLADDLSKLKEDTNQFIVNTQEQFIKMKDNYNIELNRITKEQTSPPELRKFKDAIKEEKAKSNKMRTALKTIIDCIAKLPKPEPINSPSEPITLENFRPQAFKAQINKSLNHIYNKTRQATLESFGAPAPKTDVIIKHIRSKTSRRLAELKQMYIKRLNKQRKKMDRLQREIDKAHQKLAEYSLRSTLSDREMINQIRKAQLLLNKTKNETDMKMISLNIPTSPQRTRKISFV